MHYKFRYKYEVKYYTNILLHIPRVRSSKVWLYLYRRPGCKFAPTFPSYIGAKIWIWGANFHSLSVINISKGVRVQPPKVMLIELTII